MSYSLELPENKEDDRIKCPFTFRLHNKAPHSIPMDATDVYLDGNDLGNFTSQVK